MGTRSQGFNNPRITNFTETIHTHPAGTSFNINLSLGTLQKVITSGNTTINLPNPVPGKSYTVMVQYGGTHTITWAGGGTRKWSGGSAPAATSVAGKIDYFVFTCDGTTETHGRSGGGNY
jgi:hypothetical protein